MANEEFVEDVVDVGEIVEVKDDQGNDTTDWKALALERQELALKNQGIAKRYKTKLEKSKDSVTPANPAPKTEPNKSGDLDYSQKAFLIANGVKGSDEMALVKDIMSSTGKSLDDVLESKYFQAELKERRDLKASQDAIPNGSKRSSQSARDTVDYWIAKGELPPADQRELRTKVVNARYNAAKNGNNFTDQPVVK